MPYEQWKESIPAGNKVVVGRIWKSAESKFSGLRCEKTQEEIDSGWLTEPTELTDEMMRATALAPRYVIAHPNGEQPEKARLIDDLKASGINSLVASVDTNIPDNLDVLLAATMYYKLITPCVDLQALVIDYKNAYRNTPLCRYNIEFA